MFAKNINFVNICSVKVLGIAMFGVAMFAPLSITAHSQADSQAQNNVQNQEHSRSSQYPQSLSERKNNAMGSVIGANGLTISLTSPSLKSKEQEETAKQPRQQKLLWQAAIAFLAQRPIISANYESGTIISDWHKEKQTESKVIVIINDNPDLSKALKVIAFKRISTKNVLQNATQHPYEDLQLANNIAQEIITAASQH